MLKAPVRVVECCGSTCNYYLYHIIFIAIVIGGGGSNRVVLLCLGLLNAALVIAAIAIGVNCEYDS